MPFFMFYSYTRGFFVSFSSSFSFSYIMNFQVPGGSILAYPVFSFHTWSSGELPDFLVLNILNITISTSFWTFFL